MRTAYAPIYMLMANNTAHLAIWHTFCSSPVRSGASNLPELHALLRATVMIRRLKKDILNNLPPKQRMLVEVRVEEGPALDSMR
jgi:hypothetical protein